MENEINKNNNIIKLINIGIYIRRFLINMLIYWLNNIRKLEAKFMVKKNKFLWKVFRINWVGSIKWN